MLLHLGRVAGSVSQQRLKYRQVKIMKHAMQPNYRASANYVILTKWIKLHEKNPASYLKSMQNVGFEKTSTKFIEIYVA